MALGMIERCLELSLEYARTRKQFGRRIGDYQLIQDKLARMEVARMNLQNLVFRVIESASMGTGMTLAVASAMKLYAARAAVEGARRLLGARDTSVETVASFEDVSDAARDAARRVGAERTYLTHLTHRVTQAELDERLPEGVWAAYDGLTVEVDG